MNDLSIDEMPPFSPVVEGEFLDFSVKVLNGHGLHARPSATFFEKVLKEYGDKIRVSFKIPSKDADNYVDIISVFDLMALGLEGGTLIEVRLGYGDNTEADQQLKHQIADEIYQLFLNCFNIPEPTQSEE